MAPMYAPLPGPEVTRPELLGTLLTGGPGAIATDSPGRHVAAQDHMNAHYRRQPQDRVHSSVGMETMTCPITAEGRNRSVAVRVLGANRHDMPRRHTPLRLEYDRSQPADGC